jgi:DNA-binding MarR family transcriptional regulator/N-acetylglutamate synthase-like GNAT family acetyltransferase
MAAPAHPVPAESSAAVSTIRRFNRFYTRQIGVLNEHLLQSRFSLTEVRVLYELAKRKDLTAGLLCRELALDPGYLSRMLRNFEKQGLVRRSASEADARQNLLSLTPKGLGTFLPLDHRSDHEVATLLSRLSPAQQRRLLGALVDVESLLDPKSASRSGYILRSHRPGDMGWVVHRHGDLYFKEYNYDERFEALVAEIVAQFVHHLDPKRERCWIAERDGEILGCIFLVKKSSTVAKLRLLLVEPSARGLGIGKCLVSTCVEFARKAGYKRIVLWTQSELLAARHLYRLAGFRLTGKKRHDSWGRRGLVSETWELSL